MRTTIRLSDGAYRVAEAVARQRKISLGEAISQMILRGQQVPLERTKRRGGLPIFQCERTVTAEDVRSLDDDA